MGGFFALVSESDCVHDLFYGTDYHSHLGTKRGGLAVRNGEGILRYIHNIENAQFRSKFADDLPKLKGTMGIGIISDNEDQPVLVRSHLGAYAIATVGVVHNLDELVRRAFDGRVTHFTEMRGGEINPTELVASLIDREATFVDGLRAVQESVRGSCSILLLTEEGVYAARDRLGRTPVIVGEKAGARAVALESCSFPNLGYDVARDLGPGEIVRIDRDGVETLSPAGSVSQICAFLWVYYGYPASSYEGINVEAARNRCGAALARRETLPIDLVAGIPDSGVGHGLGYAAASGIPFQRPFVKYTPTWARSFMPQEQELRDLVARMKLIPIREIISGRKLLFCEDSIVRGTQLRDTIQRLYDFGAEEVHMRPACPPLLHACPFLNFSRSRSEMDLAAQKAVREIEGPEKADLAAYARSGSPQYEAMVGKIAARLGLTSLRYQRLEDLVAAIGLPKEKVCTFCWDAATP